MVSKIAVLGSCASRDVFNTDINPNYKNYFEIVTAAERISIISLMAKPIKINNPDLIKSYHGEKLNLFGSKCIEMDFTKSFLLDLKNKDIDYLILDNLFESRFGILCYENNIITNNSWDLHHTEFYKNLKKFKTLSMSTDSDKYLKYYKKNFNLFYEYINNKCDNIKLILNKTCDTDKYLDYDGLIKIRETEYCNEHNPHTYKLNQFIEDNFDVDVIELNIVNYPNDINHKWGSGTSHFISPYYQDFTKKLNKIIQNNQQQNNLKQDIINKKEKINTMLNEYTRENTQLNNKLNRYSTSRIDVKNCGNPNNKIELISISDNKAKVTFPKWFKDKKGEGAIIESMKGEVYLKIKCIGKGKLNIKLRGIDVKYKNKRKHIYIKFTSLECNGKQIITEEKLVCHDEFYQCYLNVSAEDIVFIHAKWSPFEF